MAGYSLDRTINLNNGMPVMTPWLTSFLLRFFNYNDIRGIKNKKKKKKGKKKNNPAKGQSEKTSILREKRDTIKNRNNLISKLPRIITPHDGCECELSQD